MGRWTERGLYGKLASIVAMASGFIFAHEAAVKDISRPVAKTSHKLNPWSTNLRL